MQVLHQTHRVSSILGSRSAGRDAGRILLGFPPLCVSSSSCVSRGFVGRTRWPCMLACWWFEELPTPFLWSSTTSSATMFHPLRSRMVRTVLVLAAFAGHLSLRVKLRCRVWLFVSCACASCLRHRQPLPHGTPALWMSNRAHGCVLTARVPWETAKPARGVVVPWS